MLLRAAAGIRLLDAELKMHCKSASSEFDYKKLSFILEARGVLQEQQIERAQSRIQPAFRQSITAGFNLSLEADQVAHRRHLVAASGDTQRARAALGAARGQGLSALKSVEVHWTILNTLIGSV